MNTKRYIKVTPKGETKAVILLATNRDFYLSQGAKVEDPTEEEIIAAFPEMRRREQAAEASQKEIEEKAALVRRMEKLDTLIEKMEKRIALLEEKQHDTESEEQKAVKRAQKQ